MEVDQVIEQVQGHLGHLPGFRFKKMFGGASIYSDDVVFCMITREGVPHFRIGPGNLQDFKDEDQVPFAPKTKSKKLQPMPYYTVPSELWEDQRKLEVWVGKAISEAKAAKKK